MGSVGTWWCGFPAPGPAERAFRQDCGFWLTGVFRIAQTRGIHNFGIQQICTTPRICASAGARRLPPFLTLSIPAGNPVINGPTHGFGLRASYQQPWEGEVGHGWEGMAVLGEPRPGWGGCSVVCCVWFGSYFSSCSCIWSFEAYFPSLAKPAGSPCAAGEHKTSAFKLECSVDKDFKTLASCAVSYGLT